MNPLLKKLNYKTQAQVLIPNAPDSFQKQKQEVAQVCKVVERYDAIEEIQFALIFVTSKEEINQSIKTIVSQLADDPVLWYSYPKSSSKKYTCDFNRDNGWEALGEYGFEGVRQVSIDEDWSAIRFRKAANIKTMTRTKDFAISKEAKAKTSGK
ncbi:MAG: hypothetical protein JXR10_03735 [Cyclobacteriaceae bacterium]